MKKLLTMAARAAANTTQNTMSRPAMSLRLALRKPTRMAAPVMLPRYRLVDSVPEAEPACLAGRDAIVGRLPCAGRVRQTHRARETPR